jgi:hypothetical protein
MKAGDILLLGALAGLLLIYTRGRVDVKAKKEAAAAEAMIPRHLLWLGRG